MIPHPQFYTQCEAEQLHLSGKIQPHGACAIVDRDGLIRHVSANIHAFTGYLPDQLLGHQVPEAWLGLATGEGSLDVFKSRRELSAAVRGTDGVLLDAVVTKAELGNLLIEFSQPTNEAVVVGAMKPRFSKEAVPGNAEAVREATQWITQLVSQETGFGRVMYYHFREDGDGEVSAEVCSSKEYGSYLGLRYPASDIPLVARQLYVLNPWRLIPDIQAEAVALLSSEAQQVADLSLTDLRSVSPVHVQYLANMGVRASLSFPLLMNGELVGLIAAHHFVPRTVDLACLLRVAAQVKHHSEAMAAYQLQQRMRLVDRLHFQFSGLLPWFSSFEALSEHWDDVAEVLMQVFDGDGVMLLHGDMPFVAGESVDEEAIMTLDAQFTAQKELVWMSHHLCRDVEDYPAGEVAGAVAINLGMLWGAPTRIYLTRAEYIHEVAWGGNPEKPVEVAAGGVKISPRRSFNKWVENRRGYSRSWTNDTRLSALRLRSLIANLYEK